MSNKGGPYKDQFTPWEPDCCVSNTQVYDVMKNERNWPLDDRIDVVKVNTMILSLSKGEI